MVFVVAFVTGNLAKIYFISGFLFLERIMNDCLVHIFLGLK